MVNCVLFYTILLCLIVQSKYEIYPQLLGVNCLNQDFQDFRIWWLIGGDRCGNLSESGFPGFQDLQDEVSGG
jgi:hypothetical protein